MHQLPGIHTPPEISNSQKEYSVAEQVLFIRIIVVPPQFLSYCPTSAGHTCHLAGKSPILSPFTWHLRRPTGPTRSVDGMTFIHLPARVDCYKYSLFPRIDWNTLPSATRSLSSVNSFHNSLHRMAARRAEWHTHCRSITEELKGILPHSATLSLCLV